VSKISPRHSDYISLMLVSTISVCLIALFATAAMFLRIFLT